jgi:hypothetical protein
MAAFQRFCLGLALTGFLVLVGVTAMGVTTGLI